MVNASTASMVIQIVVLVLLIVGVLLKTKKKYRQHGIIMLSAVLLHLISILAVMGPSFSAFTNPAYLDFTNWLVLITLFHGVAGFLAALLGIFLVGSWRLKVDIQGCFKKKRFMDIALILWGLSIATGFFLFLAVIGAV